MNPYTLPEGNVQISFSGGRTSAFMLHQISEANGGIPDRCKVVFANTGREMPQTLDFVYDVSERWGIQIDWVEYLDEAPRFVVVAHNSASRDGEPFSAIIKRRRYLPNQNARFCTSELKVKPSARYLVSLGWRKWISALGIRADEPRRVKREPQKERWQRWYPLADAGASKRDVMAFWEKQPFDLRLPSIASVASDFRKQPSQLPSAVLPLTLGKRNKVKTGHTGYFEKGHEPWTKGRKMPPNAQSQATQFRRGQTPHNAKPIGYESLNPDGYVLICVDRPNPFTGYRTHMAFKHKELWVAAHGQIPEGHVLKCLDGDKTNCDPSNWECIPQGMLPRLNGKSGRAYDHAPAEVKPSILAIAKLEHRLSGLRKGKQA